MTTNQSSCTAVVSATDIDDLGSQIVGLAGRLAAAMCRWLLLVAEFDARDGAAKFGLASTSRWLSYAWDQLVGDLIMVAEHGTVGQLEIVVRGLRTVEDNEKGPAPAEEYAAWSWSSQSQWRLSARLDPERGAVVQKTVETIARTEGISHADALVRMADIAFA